MATQSTKKATVKKVKAPVPRKKREISLFEDSEIPPAVKESIYPWGELALSEAGKKSFFVACDDQEEAERTRPSVYSSGRNYYLKRRIKRKPEVRVVEKSEVWGIEAWSVTEE